MTSAVVLVEKGLGLGTLAWKGFTEENTQQIEPAALEKFCRMEAKLERWWVWEAAPKKGFLLLFGRNA